MAKVKNWQEKNWNSLTDLKNYLIDNKIEKVIKFNGFELITNKATYMLFDGQLTIKTK